MAGTLYLIPNTLGSRDAADPLPDVIPGGFLAHRTLHLPTELLVGISRRIGGLLGQQTGHIGQGDRATYLLATADEREKIE